jgi:hypothetical protein
MTMKSVHLDHVPIVFTLDTGNTHEEIEYVL